MKKNDDPHSKVDGHPNYIAILKLKNKTNNGKNYLMAMYSERPLNKDIIININDGFGFICSITNQKAFYLRNSINIKPRITMYDEHFFVYGSD